MKKFVLLTVSLMLVVTIYAQQNSSLQNGLQTAVHNPEQAVAIESVSKPTPITSSTYAVPERTKGAQQLNIFAIGQSANAYSYGYGGGQKTILWVDDHLNAVTNTHRMTSETYSGNLAMDLSLDMGQTFENNIMVYESNEPGPNYNVDAIRYPHGAIYNPVGNLDPANAYLFFFGPILDGSNSPDTWGGYGYGTANLVDHADTTKHTRPANPDEGMYQYIPEAYTVTQDGVAWVVDPADDWTSGSLNYTDNLIVNKGTFDEEEGDITYEAELMEFEVIHDEDLYYVMNEKVAFGPDGEIGYMVLLSNDESVDFSAGAIYPIVFKTTNGGDDWEYMGGIQLGGEDGIHRVKQYLTDQQIESLFEPPIPDRDEILYTTAFDFDLVVDHTGNPHIGVVVGVAGANPYSIVTEPYTFAAFDIWSTDGALTWTGLDLKKLANFRGEYGDLTEDNRIQATTTMNGEKVLISWQETDPGFSETNNMPDIRCVGLDMVARTFTDTLNVTEATVAWLQAYFFAAPHYMFTDNDQYTIPFTYEDMDPNDPTKQVTYMYIQDFTLTEGDFVHPFPDGVGMSEPVTVASDINVSQNYPNPFRGKTTIEVTTDKAVPVQLQLFSVTGQIIQTEDAGMVNGLHQFIIDGSKLTPGVYFYSIEAGEETITRKMTVK
ncbi:MAG: T9SS type A sorting domain-containing protein [Bacteroidales bacterium]|nr:T9SS type A sorting domain-containing protein [Bacteroidales bacterium]